MPKRYAPTISDPTVVVSATGGPEEVTLPAGFASGRKFTVTRTDGTADEVTVRVPSGEALDGTTDGTRLIPARSTFVFTKGDPGEWSSAGGGGGSGEAEAPAEASTTSPGTITLAGDLDGTAGAPVVTGVKGVEFTGPAGAGKIPVGTSSSQAAWQDAATAGLATVASVTSGLATKADAGTTATALAAKANATEVNTALAAKADASALTSGLAGKADASATTSALALKADASAVTAALALKADASALAAKADASTTTSALALKADASTVAAKADDNTVVKLTGAQAIAGVKTYTSSPVVPTASTSGQATNLGQVDAALALKADLTSVRLLLAWNGTAYPDRPAGRYAEFIGPAEPVDADLAAGDLWTEVDI